MSIYQESLNAQLSYTTCVSKDSIKNKIYLMHIPPPNCYAQSLPFFCKEELKVEKLVKFPVKFRLGGVDYVNKMEGKIK